MTVFPKILREQWLVVLLAVILQVQVTLFASDTYFGLRLNLADFLLPFLGVWILWSLGRKTSVWPRWYVPYMEIWCGLLVVVMSVALIQGYVTNDFLSGWAFINKYIGFLVLLAYFALGAWCATNVKDYQDLLQCFMIAFAGFMIFILSASFFSLILGTHFSSAGVLGRYSWDGMMANRNAFMVAVVFALLFLECSRDLALNARFKIPIYFYGLFWSLLPAFVVYNASRTGWIILGLVVLATLVVRFRVFFTKILPFVLLGVVMTYASLALVGGRYVYNSKQFNNMLALFQQQEQTVLYSGDQKRLIAVEDGLELYGQSNKIWGAGLGVYKEFQIEKRGAFVDLIDFTSLWLLVEAGALGVVSFGGFFVVCLWFLYQRGFKSSEPHALHRTLFFFLICFLVMSFLHELMYTRFLWFALGMGLAIPAREALKPA